MFRVGLLLDNQRCENLPNTGDGCWDLKIYPISEMTDNDQPSPVLDRFWDLWFLYSSYDTLVQCVILLNLCEMRDELKEHDGLSIMFRLTLGNKEMERVYHSLTELLYHQYIFRGYVERKLEYTHVFSELCVKDRHSPFLSYTAYLSSKVHLTRDLRILGASR